MKYCKFGVLCVLFAALLLAGCAEKTVSVAAPDTVSAMMTSTMEPDGLTEMNFVHFDGQFLYVCDYDTVYRCSPDLTRKEIVYRRERDSKSFIHSFLFFDENTLILDLTKGAYVKVDLRNGEEAPLYPKHDANSSIAMVPTKIGNRLYSRDLLFNEYRSDVLMVEVDGEWTEFLTGIADWGYDGGSIYYKLSGDNAIYKCDMDGKNSEKVFEPKEIDAFRVYKGKLFYSGWANYTQGVYDMKTGREYTISHIDLFYLSSMQFCDGFIYRPWGGGVYQKMDVDRYTMEEITLSQVLRDVYYLSAVELNATYFIGEYAYLREILRTFHNGEYPISDVRIIRQNLVDGSVEKVV